MAKIIPLAAWIKAAKARKLLENELERSTRLLKLFEDIALAAMIEITQRQATWTEERGIASLPLAAFIAKNGEQKKPERDFGALDPQLLGDWTAAIDEIRHLQSDDPLVAVRYVFQAVLVAPEGSSLFLEAKARLETMKKEGAPETIKAPAPSP
jgi:hypothetical protein